MCTKSMHGEVHVNDMQEASDTVILHYRIVPFVVHLHGTIMSTIEEGTPFEIPLFVDSTSLAGDMLTGIDQIYAQE